MEKLTAARASYLNESWNRSDVGSKRLRRYREEIVALYDAGIRWVDAQLSKLADGLRESKLWENCIFALTADHGEEFLEHDGRYHAPCMMEELIHVPLLLRVPGARSQKVSSRPFSLIHLAPTLLEAAGSAIPAEFQGRSHWTQLKAWKIMERACDCGERFRMYESVSPGTSVRFSFACGSRRRIQTCP